MSNSHLKDTTTGYYFYTLLWCVFFMIDVVKIEFKSTSTLILLRSEYTNLLEDSKKYGFDLKDIKRCRSTQMDIKDFPKNEWDC